MSKKRCCLAMVCLVGMFGVSLKAQPLAQYTFSDGTTKDVTGNGFDGILLSNVTPAKIVDDPEQGKVLQINQSGMQVDGPFDITTSFTLSAWIKIDIPRTGRHFFGGPWWFRTDDQAGSDHVWVEVRYPEGNFLNKVDTTLGGAYPDGQLDGQWHHYVFILPEDGAFQVYFDGVLAPFRDANPVRVHDFGGSVGPLFFGTQNESFGNALQGYMDNIMVFNYAVNEEEIPGLLLEGLGPEFASNPVPSSGATDVPRDVILGWKQGQSADTHNVYFGTVFDDVNDADTASPLLVSQGQDANTYDPGRLEFDQTYYWRIDEVSGPPGSTIFKGDVWSFTAEPFAYAIENITATASSSEANNGPENTVNGSGLGDSGLLHGGEAQSMWLSSAAGPQPTWIQYTFDRIYKLHELWIWNSNQSLESLYGIGVKDVTIELSTDGENWTVFADVEVAQASGTPDYTHNTTIDLQGAVAQYVRLTTKSNWKGFVPQFSLSEVRFFYLPVLAREPQPTDGAIDVDPGIAALAWRSGREAIQHEVVLSTDRTVVEDGSALVDTITENSFDPASLDLQLDETYYWRINEVNEAQDPRVWLGDIWYFVTPPCIIVDDMESYSNNPGQQMWSTWVDGYEVQDNGSLVGNGFDGVPETLIVHRGDQSMPLYYDNTFAATSVATRTYDKAQDWTRGGITTLVLYVQGVPSNNGERFFVTINNIKVLYSGNTNILTSAYWTPWMIDLSTVSADLANVTSLSVGVEGGNTGVVYIDDLLLYKVVPPVPEQVYLEAESGTVSAPFQILSNQPDASNGQYIGTFDNGEMGLRQDGMATYSFTVQADSVTV